MAVAEAAQSAGMVCGVLVAVELISRLCPKDQMVGFVKALTVLVMVLSLASAVFGQSWQWPEREAQEWRNNRLEEYVNGQYQEAAQQQAEEYLEGLLAAAGLRAEEIRLELDMSDPGNIVLTKAVLRFAYESDAQRARALLLGALDSGTAIEVTADGYE